MILRIQQLMLKVDVIRCNNNKVKQYRQKLINDTICYLTPKVASVIQDAIRHNVKELKTDDIDVLNQANLIYSKFNIKVNSCS